MNKEGEKLEIYYLSRDYRKYCHLLSNELDIEKYIEIELVTTNIDIEIFSNIVQP